MAVTPHDLMKGAERISQDISETGRRNVASRAYYAAYHACLPIAEQMGLTAMPSNSKHTSVIHTLSASRKDESAGLYSEGNADTAQLGRLRIGNRFSRRRWSERGHAWEEGTGQNPSTGKFPVNKLFFHDRECNEDRGGFNSCYGQSL